MRRLVIALMAAAFALSVAAKQDDPRGKGPGGVRAEHASEMGLEKGKAWAGTKEKEAREKAEKVKKDKAAKGRKGGE